LRSFDRQVKTESGGKVNVNSRGIYKKWKEKSHQQVSTHGEENTTGSGKRICGLNIGNIVRDLPKFLLTGFFLGETQYTDMFSDYFTRYAPMFSKSIYHNILLCL
jgi:hypothetical protein